MNTLNDFFGKNLNDKDWYIYNAFPDAKINGKFTVTLKAKQDMKLYNELTQSFITVKKGGFVRGIVDPQKGCLRVVLYIPTCIQGKDCHELLDTTSLKDVLVRPRRLQVGHLPLKERKKIHQDVVQVVRGYVPDKASCNRLYKIEQETKNLKQDLNGDIIYMPVRGIKYQELVNDPEFKKRWKPYDTSI
jgi:hypothetical protein